MPFISSQRLTDPSDSGSRLPSKEVPLEFAQGSAEDLALLRLACLCRVRHEHDFDELSLAWAETLGPPVPCYKEESSRSVRKQASKA